MVGAAMFSLAVERVKAGGWTPCQCWPLSGVEGARRILARREPEDTNEAIMAGVLFSFGHLSTR